MKKTFTLILILNAAYSYSQSSYLGSTNVGNQIEQAEPTGKIYGPVSYRGLKKAIGEKFIFLPTNNKNAQGNGYTGIYKKKDRFSGNLKYKDNVGHLLTLTAVEDKWATLLDENNKPCYANMDILKHMEGLGPVADIDSARVLFLNKTLWLKTNIAHTYNEAEGYEKPVLVSKIRPVKVVEIVVGNFDFMPVRFVIETEDKQRAYIDVSVSGTNIWENARASSSFNESFFESDPHKLYNWPEPIWTAIENTKLTIGMTMEQALLSWGKPNKINKSVNSTNVDEQWVYGKDADNQYAYFTNGVLTAMN